MPTSDGELVPDLPIVMRWKETVSGGHRGWYLASLRDDASFWGYVHIRTDSLSENRSFNGRLAKSKYDRIRSLVDTVDDDNSEPESSESFDGVIGLGTRSNFKTVLRFDPDSPQLPHSELFHQIVGILQPDVITAAHL